jgi:hypothetical protein
VAHIAWIGAYLGRHVSTRRYHAQALGALAALPQVLSQRLARYQQPLHAPIRQPIQRRLNESPHSAVVDATGRLVQHPDHGQPRLADAQPRAQERGSDAVQNRHIRLTVDQASKYGAAVNDAQRKRSVGHRHELQTRTMARRKPGQPPVVEVAAGETGRVAERHQYGI